MQTKLTLRVEEGVVRKAKRLARQKGTSVSRIFGEWINNQEEGQETGKYPPLTSSMIGVIRDSGIVAEESDYHRYLEKKYL